jgi:hypothetical protein
MGMDMGSRFLGIVGCSGLERWPLLCVNGEDLDQWSNLLRRPAARLGW